ncbi:ribbon-helix-helix domain-containing protein [uncultured Jannaschia sp.]|uniref:CopG family ribbon-helix-helix protein n=1 Tax=uncultured Jannaschia sp. TaxID=293347 RepID=UPI00261844D8|nr:ribbon-helix-helix domain-containing protein [uncultured Jannaschia sp.]
MPTAMFSTRLDEELKAELERIARAEDRSASWVANQAIRAFVQERRAVRDLVDAGLEMVERNAAGVTPEAVHEWMLDENERPFPIAG